MYRANKLLFNHEFMLNESTLEISVTERLKSLGWEYLPGAEISPGGSAPERDDYGHVVLRGRLKNALKRINHDLDETVIDSAVQKLVSIYSSDPVIANETFHRYLIEGIKIPYQEKGFERSHEVFPVEFSNPAINDYLAVNQFTITEEGHTKRADIILFVNGLPVVLMELKNPAGEEATMDAAYKQIQTYKAIIPGLFRYNEICIISDGHECRAGSFTAGINRFMAWKSTEGVKEASKFKPQIETLVEGMLRPEVLTDIIRNFIIFHKTKREDPETGLTFIITEKILAAYHQYYAVNKAVESAVRASGTGGDRRGGVIWHTQGSGKSLSMVFFAGKLITTPQMQNPTVVVITDRNDLDEQLFDTFSASVQLLRQTPVQAEDREHLKELLMVSSGGIVFTTIQKFFPEAAKTVYDLLSERSNIIVIADEAHRTQYGFEASLRQIRDPETGKVTGKKIAYGFAKYMRDALPAATYIGFTGTPVEGTDINTPQVFGNYIDVYDIARAVEDGATVKIFYESRLAKINFTEEGKQLIEELEKELERDEELTESERVKAKWSKLEAIVGNLGRLKNLAGDIISHFEARLRVFDGKTMIVCMSREIAVNLYNEIIALKPEWAAPEISQGVIKVVMTASSSDGPDLARHHTTKEQRRLLSDRMKDPDDPLKMVIVVDMWLTGFDVPCLHTMYIDKPMRGHTLMQAIARVNRVFRDKPGGLIVDYIGIATDLKKALSFYSSSGGKGDPTQDIKQAADMMIEKLEVVKQMFAERSRTMSEILVEEPKAYYNGRPEFNYKRFFDSTAEEKLSIILQAQEHILGLQDGKVRFIREVTYLSQAFALAMPHPKAFLIREETAFFQAVKSRLIKLEGGGGGSQTGKDYDSAIKMVIDNAISSEKVIDIFAAAGIEKPDISILSDEFLHEVRGMKHKNLAFELLKKLLNDEIRTGFRTNLVKNKKFIEMVEHAVKKYQNNLLTTAEIIEELIRIAREVRYESSEAERLGLTDDELAFYDALETNDSAVKVLGDDTLKTIAREIADKVRQNATIDWTIRESARAKLMVIVKRTLNKYGYPPDKQKHAIDTVLRQAEIIADEITGE